VLEATSGESRTFRVVATSQGNGTDDD
jgi:hypothetical protein